MLEKEILRLKSERNAIILAHNYQPADVQDIADLTGDSLELSRAAATIDCKVLVFCGVDFMAQTAAILSPEKIVVHPDRSACCPMAQMISPQDVRSLRERYPDAAVVCYVNSSAEVKAESDICCTSANGVQVVNALDADEILFIPDRNLAAYIARHTDKRIIPWNGYCYVHDRYNASDVLEARRKHPDAELLVHPECRPEVIELADGVYSTSGMLKHARASGADEFIIGTEIGILHRLCAENPRKRFYPLSTGAVCEDMKKTSLKKVLRALETLSPRVEVPQSTAVRARRAIERMLAV
ncbi:MAG: quinolinate synthase NadA [Methanothrix sp.]|uniref:quinolinate synthase NadA n=1 Tax=Methanothrix sp. TaxID=90426 RepID=UPI0032AFB552|nr:quinolinate synthase NadA [Methanothrix sp.]